ncbi:hypothetical protein SMAC4_13339 [Sordaria macrospora]|uniref:uncharacterized protein n=1 Tax=Sordaria macrospora TaxID=5147 RepID=UPI002B2AB040|nr:hypothetical protein SMAC4_13339 [Sordaria macrospora]
MPIHHGRGRSCSQCGAIGGGRVISIKEGNRIWPNPLSRRNNRKVHRRPKTNISTCCHSLQYGVGLRGRMHVFEPIK